MSFELPWLPSKLTKSVKGSPEPREEAEPKASPTTSPSDQEQLDSGDDDRLSQLTASTIQACLSLKDSEVKMRKKRAIQTAHQELGFSTHIVTLENYLDWMTKL